MSAPISPASQISGDYRVLARKYRPSSFAELIGHDTLVRTLSNALSSGRIAHAFMLTGVRGVGKTTTARIIARALNCVGPDGSGGPTMEPCGVCDPCRTIAEDRHPDVLEMDAASHTGVDDMRELIENVRYRPVAARYKIYIIDEVHMLSKSAFNALLKTLEEPPPDIKFVFATTEINKVPITVLSRCQRYTLPRVAQETLIAHYRRIAGLEAVEIEDAALAHIARAADGSVRDGLSILDQAIALSFGNVITETAMRDMLGVADRGIAYDLFEAVMSGDAGAAIAVMERLYNAGTDPAMALQDLLDITHYVTRVKLEEATSAPPQSDGHDRARAQALAAKLGIAALARCWQMLLKGLSEVQTAPNPLKAAEMVLIRLAYVTDLPPPGELAKMIQSGALKSMTGSDAGTPPPAPPRPRAIAGGLNAALAVLPIRDAPALDPTLPQPRNFTEIMELIAVRRQAILYARLAEHVHLVRFEVGHIEFRPASGAPRDLSTQLGKFLLDETGRRWIVSISGASGEPTLRQQEQAKAERLRAEVTAHPLVQAALAAFPDAVLDKIRDDAIAGAPDLSDTAEIASEDEPGNLYEDGDPGPTGDFTAYDGEEDMDEL